MLGRSEPSAPASLRPNVSKHDWLAAVGPRIAERAEPIEIDRGTLIVRVATSVWASELSLLAIPIKARLAERGVVVSALRYRVGPIEAPVRPTALRETRIVPAPLPLPEALGADLDRVGDEELRAVITEAARANLAWQAYTGNAHDLPTRPDGLPRSATSRAARVPRSAGTGSGPPDQTPGAAPGAPRRRP